MPGFESFNRTRRLNNLSLLSNRGGFNVSPVASTESLGSNNYRSTFTSPGDISTLTTYTYNPSKKRQISATPGSTWPGSFEILVVAGGGGGNFGGGGGAGGGGGVVYVPSFPANGVYTVVVGSAGTGEGPGPYPGPGVAGPGYPAPATGAPGGNSEIYLTSSGPGPSVASPTGLKAIGGGGAQGNSDPKPGGSGGGSGGTGGTGIQPTITHVVAVTQYGNPGGNGLAPSGYAHSGGGGGAGGAGAPGPGPAGAGGSGYDSSISGSPYPYSAGAGGGTGGRWTGPGGSWNGGYGARGSPLSGRGGGCPPAGPNAAQETGYAATGYGAGGGPGGNFIHVGPSSPGTNGYQGVVIIKYSKTSN